MLLGDVVEPNHAGPCSTSAAVRRSFVARRGEPIVHRKTGRGTDEAVGPDRSLVSSVAIRPRGAEPSNPENFPPFRPPTKPSQGSSGAVGDSPVATSELAQLDRTEGLCRGARLRASRCFV